VYVKGPAYQAITVQARVAAERYAAFDAVERDVVAAINGQLAPLARSFGEDFYPTSLYNAILDVAGVAAVPMLSVLVDGRPHPLAEAVIVPPDGLVYGAPDHEIVVEAKTDR
jgi:hypothetical protein